MRKLFCFLFLCQTQACSQFFHSVSRFFTSALFLAGVTTLSWTGTWRALLGDCFLTDGTNTCHLPSCAPRRCEDGLIRLPLIFLFDVLNDYSNIVLSDLSDRF
jgi:hypothetical protein